MSSTYGWVIDRDYLAEDESEEYRTVEYPAPCNCNAPGMMGPRDIPDEIVERLNWGQGQRFRIFDDDRNLYYAGRYIGPDGEEAFGPLWDFAGPNAGAVTIKYFEGGKWVVL